MKKAGISKREVGTEAIDGDWSRGARKKEGKGRNGRRDREGVYQRGGKMWTYPSTKEGLRFQRKGEEKTRLDQSQKTEKNNRSVRRY